MDKNIKDMKIGVLMGGMSSEREISLITGGAVFSVLKENGYNAASIDVGRDLPQRIMAEGIDVAFIALHGKYGEDGTVQGLLDLMGIPYTGSSLLGSAMAMDKIISKEIYRAHNLPTPDYVALRMTEIGKGNIPSLGKFPVVVKPANGGSTIGITIVEGESGLRPAVEEAAKWDDNILIEEFIEGTLLTAGVLGDEALPVIEIAPKSGFYDYESKYTKGATEYILPARLTDKDEEECRRLAIASHKALRCGGATRTDMILDKGGRIYILETNTIPGMTGTSLLPMAAKAAGYSFIQLVVKILEGTLKKG